MSITLSRLYDDYAAATLVVRELESVGIPASEISIVASNAENWYSSKGTMSSSSKHDRDRDDADDRAEGAATGAGIGATVGGIAGLLAALGISVAGGILGALTEAGVSEQDAEVYAEGVRRGGTLLTVRVPEGDQKRVEAILDRSAVNIREREMTYRKSGWSSFDPDAPPYTADQVRKERDLHRRNAA